MAEAGVEDDAGPPDWVRKIVRSTRDIPASRFSAFLPPSAGPRRRAAILLLFGQDDSGAGDLLLIERAHDMRSHAGQVAFPGGGVDATDADEVAAALREAQEETGLDPSGVDVLGTLPDLYIPVSGFAVTPVLGWWRKPSPVSVVDPVEVASVHRVPIAELVDPAHRLSIRTPVSDLPGTSHRSHPAFHVGGLLIWGFTAGLLARLLDVAGLSHPWDESRVEDLPSELLAMALRSRRDALEGG